MPVTRPRSDQIRFDSGYADSQTAPAEDAQSAIEFLDGVVAANAASDAATTDAIDARLTTAESEIVANDGDISALQQRAADIEAVDTTQNGRLDALETTSANLDTTYVNETGEETITGSLTVDQIKIDGSAITTTDATSLTLGESGETVVIPGSLSVSGTTTTVNSNEVNIGDAIIKLNSDLPDNTAPSEDGGFEVYRGTGTNAEPSALLVFRESTDDFAFSTDGGTSFETIASTDDIATASAGLQSQITANSDAITSNDGDISSLQTEQAAQGTRITTLETEMDAEQAKTVEQDGRLDAIDTVDAQQTTDIASNATSIQSNADRIAALETTAGTRSVTGNYSVDSYPNTTPGTTFSMTRAAQPQFTNVFLNGIQLVDAGATPDYSVSGTTVTLSETTLAGDTVRIEAFDSISV